MMQKSLLLISLLNVANFISGAQEAKSSKSHSTYERVLRNEGVCYPSGHYITYYFQDKSATHFVNKKSYEGLIEKPILVPTEIPGHYIKGCNFEQAENPKNLYFYLRELWLKQEGLDKVLGKRKR